LSKERKTRIFFIPKDNLPFDGDIYIIAKSKEEAISSILKKIEKSMRESIIDITDGLSDEEYEFLIQDIVGG